MFVCQTHVGCGSNLEDSGNASEQPSESSLDSDYRLCDGWPNFLAPIFPDSDAGRLVLAGKSCADRSQKNPEVVCVVRKRD